MESLFILNSNGTFLVEKHFGLRPLRRELCAPLLQALCSSRGSSSSKGREWSEGGGRNSGGLRRGEMLLQQLPHIVENRRERAVLFLVRHADLFFVAAATAEVEPLLVLELLQQMVFALAYYCGSNASSRNGGAADAAGAFPAAAAGGTVSSAAAAAGVAAAAGQGGLADVWGGGYGYYYGSSSSSSSSSSSFASSASAAAAFSGGRLLLLTEDSLRENYSLVFALLDEMCCSGYPATVQPNVLQLLVSRPSFFDAAIKLVNGSSRVLASLATSIGLLSSPPAASPAAGGGGGAAAAGTAAAGGGRFALAHAAAAAAVSPASRSLLSFSSEPGEGMGLGSGYGEGSGISGAGSSCWWRRGGLRYATHEIYVDVIERISAIVTTDGQLLQAFVDGKILLNSRLSSIPELRLCVRRAEVLAAAALHPSIRLASFRRDGVLCFCPPDGPFTLASYWLPDTKFILPVVVSGSVTFPSFSSSCGSSVAACGWQSSSSLPLQQQQQPSVHGFFGDDSTHRKSASSRRSGHPGAAAAAPAAAADIQANSFTSAAGPAAPDAPSATAAADASPSAAGGCAAPAVCGATRRSRSSSGRVELRLAAFCPVGAAGGGSSGMHATAAAAGRPDAARGGGAAAAAEALQQLRVVLRLPPSVAAATVTATIGAVQFCPSASVLVWDVGSLPFDAPVQRAEGALTLSVQTDLDADIPPCETSLVASASFLIKNWVPSGIKVESLEASRVSPPPYKGCRYTTASGNIEYRIACNSSGPF